MVSCAECGYWEPGEDTPGWGACRRHAPSPKVTGDAGPFVNHGTNKAIWPYTRSVDGCGEGMEAVRPIARPNQNSEPPDKFASQVKTLIKPTFNDIVLQAKEKSNG